MEHALSQQGPGFQGPGSAPGMLRAQHTAARPTWWGSPELLPGRQVGSSVLPFLGAEINLLVCACFP